MEALRKKSAVSGLFAAFFFAVFAVFLAFHHHEATAGESSAQHCVVCHQASQAKASADRPASFVAPEPACDSFLPLEIFQVIRLVRFGSDPIRGPPLA